MNDGLVPNRYAKALYKYATERSETEQVYEQMKNFYAVLCSVEGLIEAIKNPYLPVADKERIISTATNCDKGTTLNKFIVMVMENNRGEFIGEIVLSYLKMYRQNNNISQVQITLASDVADAEKGKIIKIVQNSYEGKTLEVEYIIDESIIGGFIVKVDSAQLDASIKNEFKKLRLKLIS